jgi:hypothetical protein
MSENLRVVQMAVINPGETAANGEFTFALQPRFNPARTVQFELQPTDAEAMYKALGAYLKAVRKEK